MTTAVISALYHANFMFEKFQKLKNLLCIGFNFLKSRKMDKKLTFLKTRKISDNFLVFTLVVSFYENHDHYEKIDLTLEVEQVVPTIGRLQIPYKVDWNVTHYLITVY